MRTITCSRCDKEFDFDSYPSHRCPHCKGKGGSTLTDVSDDAITYNIIPFHGVQNIDDARTFSLINKKIKACVLKSPSYKEFENSFSWFKNRESIMYAIEMKHTNPHYKEYNKASFIIDNIKKISETHCVCLIDKNPGTFYSGSSSHDVWLMSINDIEKKFYLEKLLFRNRQPYSYRKDVCRVFPSALKTKIHISVENDTLYIAELQLEEIVVAQYRFPKEKPLQSKRITLFHDKVNLTDSLRHFLFTTRNRCSIAILEFDYFIDLHVLHNKRNMPKKYTIEKEADFPRFIKWAVWVDDNILILGGLDAWFEYSLAKKKVIEIKKPGWYDCVSLSKNIILTIDKKMQERGVPQMYDVVYEKLNYNIFILNKNIIIRVEDNYKAIGEAKVKLIALPAHKFVRKGKPWCNIM